MSQTCRGVFEQFFSFCNHHISHEYVYVFFAFFSIGPHYARFGYINTSTLIPQEHTVSFSFNLKSARPMSSEVRHNACLFNFVGICYHPPQTTYRPTRPTRKRTLSLASFSSIPSKITLNLFKAEPATVNLHTRSHSVYGSFAPTPSALPALRQLKPPSAHTKSFLMRHPHRIQIIPRRWTEDEVDSPFSSHVSSPSIPSLSRTSSIPPDSPAASTRTTSTLVELNQAHFRKGSNELDPILAKLERKSKLLMKKVYCSTCNKAGSDYPKCGKCNSMWCSRECRMLGGKRHICSSRT